MRILVISIRFIVFLATSVRRCDTVVGFVGDRYHRRHYNLVVAYLHQNSFPRAQSVYGPPKGIIGLNLSLIKHLIVERASARRNNASIFRGHLSKRQPEEYPIRH